MIRSHTYIPELKGEGRERITIEHLLTHRSGYAPDFDLRERWTGYDEAIKRLDQGAVAKSARQSVRLQRYRIHRAWRSCSLASAE